MLQIGTGADIGGVLATHLGDQRLGIRRLGQLAMNCHAGCVRAGEGDAIDVGMGDQRLAAFVVAGDQIDEVAQAGLAQGVDQQVGGDAAIG
ncbi:hypothetical protein D9M71_278630 [compost metagenome]